MFTCNHPYGLSGQAASAGTGVAVRVALKIREQMAGCEVLLVVAPVLGTRALIPPSYPLHKGMLRLH